MRKFLPVIATAIILLFTVGCGQIAFSASETPTTDIVAITFDFKKQSGYASNQFAIWVEDQDGNLLKTLYATRFTAKGGYAERPDAIPVWVSRSGVSNMKDADAISGATPKSGALSYFWDLTDADGMRVQDGTYHYFVEGTLRWKNHVLYSGEITIDGSAVSTEATPEYSYAASADQAALTSDSPENNMIRSVAAQYIPPEQP